MNTEIQYDYPNSRLATFIYEQNKSVGWWDNPDRPIRQLLMLVITEIAEATEAFRKNLMDDKLPQYKGEYVELADAVIRLLDICGRYSFEFSDQAHYFDTSECNIHGSKYSCASEYHFECVNRIMSFADRIYSAPDSPYMIDQINHTISYIYVLAKFRGCDNFGQIIKEKLEFNRNRADHRRENRSKEGGKKI